MYRVMVFIDYQNFNINLHKHYEGKDFKPINYCALAKVLSDKIPVTSEVIKTYLFAYKPCDELLKLEKHARYYKWLCELKKTPYLEIIEGRQELRRIYGITYNIDDPNTYYTEEKETDINLATHMLAKGFQNAYDIAILVSGDTDYIKVVETLHNIGKTVVVAHFKHQNIAKYSDICDANIVLYDDVLDKAINKSYLEKHDKKDKHILDKEENNNERQNRVDDF